MKAFPKCWSLTLIPLVFGLIAWFGAAPTPKVLMGRIVFEHAPDGSDPGPTVDVYSVNADGTGLRALTNDGHSHTPSWSPDGRHILLIHDTFWPSRPPALVDKNWLSHFPLEVCVMDSDGGNAHLLRQLDGVISSTAWLPDGKNLAVNYRSMSEGGKTFALSVIPVKGQGKPRLLIPGEVSPAWSPDGKKLAFAVRSIPMRSDDWRIAVSDADGSHRKQLTDPHRFRYAGGPAWSPDGKEIAFSALFVEDPGPELAQVFVMRADGSGIRQLTTDPQWGCEAPTWSPDGSAMAFYCRSEPACAEVNSPSRLGPPFSVGPEPVCLRRIFVLSLRDPHAKPIQITQIDGAGPVFAPVP
jgi:Tol biopolymer transport system component